MNNVDYNWNELWELFEQLTQQPRNKHKQLIHNMPFSSEKVKRELQKLLDAHYTESSILDKQPQWQSEFAQAFKPPKEIHGYSIQKKLGSGGIGEVYLASKNEEGFERKVAIKFATTGRYSQHVLTSFNRELEILLSLNHENIERLYDGGITRDNIPFLIVEYIDGLHIDLYCDQLQLGVDLRLKLFQKICQAVDTVHRSLIIHRDIKAGNIMINAEGQPKLLDFGLAKLTEKDNNQQAASHTLSSLMMTLAYASPEQINGNTITTASDIYALGILLHYLMTGALPYHVEANNLATAIDTISNHVPKLASKNIQQSSVIAKTEKKLNRKLTGEIEQIIAKAIAKEPQRRYLSAAQLSQDIDNYWHNRPVMAKKDSLFYRSKKFVQRHVFGVSLGAIAVIALLVLTTTLFLQSKDLQQSLKRISNEQQRVVQVTDFLKNMFKISDPLVTDAKIIQVKDLLDYSRQKLDAEFSDEPITKATLYETLGNVYLNLSHLKQAESLFDKAYALFESEHDDTGLLRIYLAKTRLLQQQGKLKAAQAQTDALLKRFKFEQLDKPIQAEIEVFQAQNYYQLGKFKQAKRQLLSALDKRLEIYGEENTLVVDIYQLLGNVYWRLGDFKQVQKYYQKSYDLNKSLLGESHHKTIKSRSALGVLAYSQGKYSKALEDFNYVAKARLNRLGDKHILTASAFNRLGATYFEAGLYDQAEKHLNTALTIFDNLGLSQSMKYARTLNNLGLVERQNKQYSKAQQTFIKAKAIEIKNLGETHVDVAGINNNVGMVAADLGNFQQALALFKQAYHVLYEKQGMKNANIAFSMTNIGRMYLQMGDTQQAQDWINRALKLRQEKLGKDHLYTIETLSAAAEIDMENGSLVQAKEKLQHIIKLRKNQLPKNDWRIAESQALLALLNSQHDSSQTHWYYCQLQIVSEKLGNNHYRTLRLKHKQATFKLPAMVNIPECNGL